MWINFPLSALIEGDFTKVCNNFSVKPLFDTIFRESKVIGQLNDKAHF